MGSIECTICCVCALLHEEFSPSLRPHNTPQQWPFSWCLSPTSDSCAHTLHGLLRGFTPCTELGQVVKNGTISISISGSCQLCLCLCYWSRTLGGDCQLQHCQHEKASYVCRCITYIVCSHNKHRRMYVPMNIAS